jgi:hypothetical protein
MSGENDDAHLRNCFLGQASGLPLLRSRHSSQKLDGNSAGTTCLKHLLATVISEAESVETSWNFLELLGFDFVLSLVGLGVLNLWATPPANNANLPASTLLTVPPDKQLPNVPTHPLPANLGQPIVTAEPAMPAQDTANQAYSPSKLRHASVTGASVTWSSRGPRATLVCLDRGHRSSFVASQIMAPF